MPKMEPEQKIYAIVILGDFNPAIFHTAKATVEAFLSVFEVSTVPT